jgi:hypothetical protein
VLVPTYDALLVAQGSCPNLVLVPTEDGVVDGRCLAPITDHEVGACAGHAEEIRSWRSMDEGEKAQWELDQEGF